MYNHIKTGTQRENHKRNRRSLALAVTAFTGLKEMKCYTIATVKGVIKTINYKQLKKKVRHAYIGMAGRNTC